MKIIIDVKNGKALFMWMKGKRTEYVVARLEESDESKKAGDVVESWNGGHYFFKLKDAVEYFER